MRLNTQKGHPMDLFLKISALQAIFCWLGDLEKMMCPCEESVFAWEVNNSKAVSEGPGVGVVVGGFLG